jgi:hypothetical protein
MLTLKFRSKLRLYPGPGGWHFITLPAKHAKLIKASLHSPRRGWGSVRVNAAIGKTSWKTSIFPDRKSDSYLLPVKADVRMNENLGDGDTAVITLDIMI